MRKVSATCTKAQGGAPPAGMKRRASIYRSLLIVLLVGIVSTDGPGPACAAGPAEDQFAVATGHYSRRDWDLAAIEWRAFLKRYPNHRLVPAARYYLGESLTQLGAYADVSKNLRVLIEQYPESVYADKALFRCGEALYLQRQYAAARRLLQRHRRAHSGDRHAPHVLFYMARIDQIEGRPGAAISNYRRLLAEHGDHALCDAARLQLARLLEDQGQLDAATGFLRFVSEHGQRDSSRRARLELAQQAAGNSDWPQVLQLARPLIDTPHTELASFARLLLAEALVETNAASEALQTLRPIGSDAKRSIQLQAALLRSEAYIELRRPDDADRVLAEAIERFGRGPDTVELRWQRMHAHELRGRLSQAVEIGSELLAIDDLDADLRTQVLRRQLRLLAKQERFPEMLPLVSPEPSDAVDEPWVVYFISLSLVATGKASRAIDWLDELERRIPNYKELDARLRRALFELRAGAETQQERIDAARRSLRAWHELLGPPADAGISAADDAATEPAGADERRRYREAVLRLARTAARKEDRDTARALFQELLQADDPKTRSEALSGMAWLALDAGDASTAATWFDRLLKKYAASPLAPVAALQRGAALERLQQSDGALAMYSLVVDRYGETPEAPYALFAAAQLHSKLGHHESAAERLEQLLADYHDFPQRDAAWYHRAWSLSAMGRTEDAVEAYRVLRARHPGSRYFSDGSYRLARLLMEQDHLPAARKIVGELSERDDLDEQLVVHVAFLRLRLAVLGTDWSEVAASSKQVLRGAPAPGLAAQATFWHAESLFRQSEWDAAWKVFVQTYARRDLLSAKLALLVRLRQAQIRAHQEQWSEGLKLAQDLIEAGAQSQASEAEYVRGRCLVGLGRIEAARRAFERAVALSQPAKSETAAMADWMIGETLFMQKQYDEAIRAYLRIESLYAFPRWQAAGLLQAGKCCEMIGNWDRAMSFYGRIVDEYGTTEHATEAARRLGVVRQRAEASH